MVYRKLQHVSPNLPQPHVIIFRNTLLLSLSTHLVAMQLLVLHATTWCDDDTFSYTWDILPKQYLPISLPLTSPPFTRVRRVARSITDVYMLEQMLTNFTAKRKAVANIVYTNIVWIFVSVVHHAYTLYDLPESLATAGNSKYKLVKLSI